MYILNYCIYIYFFCLCVSGDWGAGILRFDCYFRTFLLFRTVRGSMKSGHVPERGRGFLCAVSSGESGGTIFGATPCIYIFIWYTKHGNPVLFGLHCGKLGNLTYHFQHQDRMAAF